MSRRRHINHRILGVVTGAVLLCIASGNPLYAQQLKLQVDRQSGALSLTGVDSSVVDFAAYQVVSQRGALTPAAWNGIRDTEANWVVFGTSGSGSLAEANSDGEPTAGAVVNNTLSFTLGNAYDPSAIVAGLPLGEDVESNDLSLVYYDQIVALTRNGTVEYVGEKIFNNIGITVDLANGKAYLENESPNALTITGYTIASNSALLNAGAGYTGLGGGFQKGPAVRDGNGLGDIDLSGVGQLLSSSMSAGTLGIDLGIVVATDPTSLYLANNDLSFSFLLDGAGQSSRAGFVKYINVPSAIPGDFNGDLVVDAADYTVWRDNEGAANDDALLGAGDGNPGVDAGDYNLWKANYGLQVGSTASASALGVVVPEPTSCLLCVLAGVALTMSGRGRHVASR